MMIHAKDKPTLVIGCSHKKADTSQRAIDLYRGTMYQQLASRMKACGITDPLEYFNVIILSAKHGFINASTQLEPYDLEMSDVKDTNATESFLKKHKKTGGIFNIINKDKPVFIFLTNKYLHVYDQFIARNYIKQDDLSPHYYVCRDHQGILQQKSRFGRCIDTLLSKDKSSTTVYRSGLSSFADLAYFEAKNAVGTSLAHCSSSKNPALRSRVLIEARNNKVFWDNGLITKINKGEEIDTDFVFAEYDKLIDDAIKMHPDTPKNISIVIPDAPYSDSGALAVLVKYKDQIKRLSQHCTVILPVHKYDDLVKFTEKAMAILDWPENICLGCPCLEKKDTQFMLSLKQIETLLQCKSPNGENTFKSIHFLGMSDVTYAKKLNSRILLAQMYVDSIQLDACRSAAVFGKNRKGTKLQREIEADHFKGSVVNSVKFKNRTYVNSADEIMEYINDLLTEDDVIEWYRFYNEIMQGSPHYQLVCHDDWSSEELVEAALQFTGHPSLCLVLFENIKMMNWERFIDNNVQVSRLTGSQSRYKAIVEMFTEKLAA